MLQNIRYQRPGGFQGFIISSNVEPVVQISSINKIGLFESKVLLTSNASDKFTSLSFLESLY